MKKNSFEWNLSLIDEIIEKLEKGDLNLNDSLKEYEKAMKLLKKSSDILDEAEGVIKKISLDKNDDIVEEVLDYENI
ncbi:MAG: exodeoxyribonuclease VII small subunit [Cetobacterium sp.]|uniref:Exodeoxyribonuclease 7 small subunit n=1 Tax=Cetobacterium ceti TaxID=180163 RepID=A0A1T4KYG7_9FUSO|nr:exodeoxyribonuclease VII small subunit [Cetobacterium ceti]MCJ8342605.1 exodeoxyribonuclease VII small subunit [Cetobacterium sp.]SJZ47505.1 Exodeoxyribonuclease VII small subunit [Cetobacterium ceti]